MPPGEVTPIASTDPGGAPAADHSHSQDRDHQSTDAIAGWFLLHSVRAARRSRFSKPSCTIRMRSASKVWTRLLNCFSSVRTTGDRER